MVMQYHWGLGVGHAYAHGQGIGNETVQNQTSERDGHDTVENDWNEDIHDSFPNLSDNGEDEEALDRDVDNDLHGGSEFGSEVLTRPRMMISRTTTLWTIRTSHLPS